MPVQYRLVQAQYLGYSHFKAEPYVTFLSLAFEKSIPESQLSISNLTYNVMQLAK